MSTKSKLPELPKLPTLGTLPKIGAPIMPTMPKLKTLAEIERDNENPLDRNNEKYLNDAEHDAALDMEVINDEFAAIHAARKQQAEAVELANDTEFWFSMYFQSREQKDAFLAHLGIQQNKYIDGQVAAQIMGIKLPPRPAPFKVGRIDKKLAALT